jgi:hypothetical protein
MKDPYTNEEFEPRRSNQRFANAKNRQDYHNANAKRLRKVNAPFDKPMSQNRKILDKLMEGKDKLKESQEFLRGTGFDPSTFHKVARINGQTGYVIYNYTLIYSESYVTILRNN